MFYYCNPGEKEQLKKRLRIDWGCPPDLGIQGVDQYYYSILERNNI
jgi:hypothetical protein